MITDIQTGGYSFLDFQIIASPRLCMSMGFGLGYDGLAYVLRPGVLDLLRMKADDMFGFSIEIHDRFTQAEGLLNIA
jgi:hypothetical protein